MNRHGVAFWRLWRPLIGVTLAYAVAAQALLIAIGGFALPAQADAAAPTFELCLHDRAAPDAPAPPSHAGCTHCIFCFAGAHHAVTASPPAPFRRVDIQVVHIPQLIDQYAHRGFSAHAIASPRGPPHGV